MYIRTYSTRNITNVSILIDSEEAHFLLTLFVKNIEQHMRLLLTHAVLTCF